MTTPFDAAPLAPPAPDTSPARVVVRKRGGEYLAIVYDAAGRRNEGATYYTDDRDDAVATGRDMARRLGIPFRA